MQLDRFDRVQLEDVLAVCRDARSLSAAGRELFASSRSERRSVNDADRLRKYLARFGIEFGDVKGNGAPVARLESALVVFATPRTRSMARM